MDWDVHWGYWLLTHGQAIKRPPYWRVPTFQAPFVRRFCEGCTKCQPGWCWVKASCGLMEGLFSDDPIQRGLSRPPGCRRCQGHEGLCFTSTMPWNLSPCSAAFLSLGRPSFPRAKTNNQAPTAAVIRVVFCPMDLDIPVAASRIWPPVGQLAES